MARISTTLAFALFFMILCPPGARARSHLAGSSVGEEISSMEHTMAVLEGRDLDEMEDEGQDIIEVDDDDDDEDGVEPRMFSDVDAVSRRSKFFSSLDDTLGILGKIEDLREAVDEAEEEEEEQEEAEGGDIREAEEDVEEEEDDDEDLEPMVSLNGSRMFLDRSDNVPEPEEELGSLTRNEPEDADQTLEEEEEEEEEDDAALLDVASDEAMEAMIESNEIPDNEGPVRMEEEPTEFDIAETEATDSGDVEELMADPDMEDADESDDILEETEVDEDEEDETFVDVEEVETVEDEDDDEATVEVEEEEEEDEDDDERGIFRSLLSLFKRS